jgi:hypothetical protein
MSGNEDGTKALNTIISALSSLKSDDRHRVVNAALLFLNEKTVEPTKRQLTVDEGKGGDGGTYSTKAQRWMKQNHVTADELEEVFDIKDDKTFEIRDVPGTSMKERTLNTYILTGLGKFLAADEKKFDDGLARKYCEDVDCYDAANHSVYIEKRGKEFSGNKTKGWQLTPKGLKTAAALVKAYATAE